MPYRRPAGDYRSGYAGGLGIVAAIGRRLIPKAAAWLGRATQRTAAGAMRKIGAGGAGAAAGMALTAGAGPISRLGIPMPGGGTLRPGALLPGGMPAYTPGAENVPRGYRLNKTGYHLRDGTYIPPGTKVVKIRRRNMANGRALNRAIGRVSGFNNLVKRSRKNLRALSRI